MAAVSEVEDVAAAAASAVVESVSVVSAVSAAAEVSSAAATSEGAAVSEAAADVAAESAAVSEEVPEAAAESSVFCSGPVVPAAAEESGTSGFPPFIFISVKGSVGIETTELCVDACPDSEGAELV